MNDNIKEKYPIPTGYLFVDEYSKGELETLSIGDYGKNQNVKADFLGYDNEIEGVPNGHCMPLSDKWVITLSTQYGCSCDCQFCDVPKVDFQGNVTFPDLKKQLYNALSLFSDQVSYTNRLNIHYARMGEPTFNDDVWRFSRYLYRKKASIEKETGVSFEVIHPVLSTMAPKAVDGLEGKLYEWALIKNQGHNGQAGLQLSINSTDEDQRNDMFNGRQASLEQLSEYAELLPDPIGRKYTLNFALASGYKVNADKLRNLFSPKRFTVKITPIHNNNACEENDIETVNGYESYAPYKQAEEDLQEVGFDTIVFVPSIDEEDGLVTCGNAVLSGADPKTTEDRIKIRGIDK